MDIKIYAFSKDCSNELCVDGIEGVIEIADYQETLYIPLDWWSVAMYRQQWKDGLIRLKGHDKSCLVVAINNSNFRHYIEWWLLYKKDNKIYIQNQILTDEIYENRLGNKRFSAKTCYDFIPERGEPYDEDGNKISEWVVDWNE